MINILWGEILADQNFMRTGCLQTLGAEVAWTDAVMAGKFESHLTGRHCMFAKSISERDRVKTAICGCH